jgi:CrcB protein
VTRPSRSLGRALPSWDVREIGAVFAGGALGTLARAGLAEAYPHGPTSWPWPTFIANVVAALLLGYVVTRLQERLPVSSYRRPLLGTGLCGGLSTFSTMQVEVLDMLDAKAYPLAAAYVATSVLIGLVAVQLATALVRRTRIVR